MKTSINEFDLFSEGVYCAMDELKYLVDRLKERESADCIYTALVKVFLDETKGQLYPEDKLRFIRMIIES